MYPVELENQTKKKKGGGDGGEWPRALKGARLNNGGHVSLIKDFAELYYANEYCERVGFK